MTLLGVPGIECRRSLDVAQGDNELYEIIPVSRIKLKQFPGPADQLEDVARGCRRKRCRESEADLTGEESREYDGAASFAG